MSCLVLFCVPHGTFFLNKMSLWEKRWRAEKVGTQVVVVVLFRGVVWVFGYSEIHSSRWWFTEVVGVVNHVAAANKIEVGCVKELKSYLILVVGKWKCVLIDKVGVSQKRFQLLFGHLAFFLMLGLRENWKFLNVSLFFLSRRNAESPLGCVL